MRAVVNGLVCLAVMILLSGCGARVDPGTRDERDSLDARSQAAMADFQAADPSLKTLLQSAAAYVIFPDVADVAVVFGGSYGKGEASEGGKVVGYADISQASVGAQLGGQGFAELIVFQTASAFTDFTQSTTQFDARAAAVAASNGAATSSNYRRGLVVFTLPQGGLMAQAAVGVQKFRYTPIQP